MNTNPPSPPNFSSVGCLAGLGLAAVLVALAFFQGGGGHGWTTPVFPSLLSLVAFPALGNTVVAGPSASRLRPAVVIATVLLIADVYLVMGTLDEVEYFYRSWIALPLIVGGWLLTWCTAQVMAISILFECWRGCGSS